MTRRTTAADPRRRRRRGHLPQPQRHPHRPGLPGRRRARRPVGAGAGAAAALRRRPARPEDARHGRPDALPRDQEAAGRHGRAAGHRLRQPDDRRGGADRRGLEGRPQAGRLSASSWAWSTRRSSQPLVLVVDDDRDLCANLWDLFRERGYRVCLAHDGARGGRAAQGDADYKVVLIDMQTPRRRRRRGLPDGPRGEPAGPDDPDHRLPLGDGSSSSTQMLAEGADAVCYKPFDVPDLLDSAGAAGRGHRARRPGDAPR